MSKHITRIICMILTLAMVAAFALVPMASAAAATKTIYFDNTAKKWSKVNVYTWTDGSGEFTGGWPGSAMTKVDGNIYSYEVPTNAVKIIFNNGEGAQTSDLNIPTDAKNLYNGSSWSVYGEAPVPAEYCLVGYINGANYGCEDDHANVGEYVFTNGKLVATFTADSYIFVKTTDNSKWLLASAYCQDTSCTFVEGGSEKMFVPGGVQLTFTLVENADGSVTVSYVKATDTCAHKYTSKVVAPTCDLDGYTEKTCSLCGDVVKSNVVPATGHNFSNKVVYPSCEEGGYTRRTCNTCGYSDTIDQVAATGHSYYNGTCVNCGKADPNYNPSNTGYYLFGYINGADYGVGDDLANLGDYKFVNGKVTVSFTEESYVAVKTGDNANFYMTNGYVGSATTATLYKFTDPYAVSANKLMIPGGQTVTFTLSESWNGNLVLSYVVDSTTCIHASHNTQGVCITCGASVSHNFSNGACTICGKADEDYNPFNYYLYGYINGADYGNGSVLGDYKFVNGQLTATFTADSYIAVKEVYPYGKFGAEVTGLYMTQSYCTDTTGIFYNTTTGANEKMFVPGGVALTFTLTVNEDGTLTVSYDASGCAHSYSESITTAPGCLSNGVKTFTCTKCGYSYTEAVPAVGHNYVNGKCTGCGITDPSVSGAAYCLVGYINGANYGCEDDHANIGQYIFVNGKVTATFTQDSYIFVKSTDNTKWFLASSYTTDSTCTFYQGASEKMFVPGNTALTFTLTENEDGSVTVSYTTATASTVPTLTLKSPTLEFKDMITVNAMFTAENIGDVVEMGMITYSSKVSTWNVNTAEHVVPGTTYDAATGRYIAHSQGIHAKYLGDTVYLATYAKLADGTYAYSKLASYSPVQYATSQLKNSTDTKLKQLVAAMLNYGAEAQLFFGHNTGALANASMTAAQKALPAAYSSSMVSAVPSASTAKQGTFANNSGFSKRYPAISFEGAFCINYFFTPNYTPDNGITLYYWDAADFNAASVLTTANASGSFKLTGSGTGEYSGDIVGISAKNLSEAVYVAAVYTSNGTTWTSGVLGYSIGAYCSSQASKGADVAALAKATAVYGYHAKAYFG